MSTPALRNSLTRALTLDQATTTGWAFGDETSIEKRQIEFGRFRMPKRDQFGDRLVFFRDQLFEVVDFYKPIDLIAFEEPFWPRAQDKKPGAEEDEKPFIISADTLKFLQRLVGVVEESAARLGIPYEMYASSSWRKTAIGFGRRPKGTPDNFMKKAMVRKARAIGCKVEDDNEADAIGILLHALCGPPANERKMGGMLIDQLSRKL